MLQHIQNVMDLLPGGILVVDENKIIIQCNRTRHEFFDKVEVTMSGQPASAILPTEVLTLLDTIMNKGGDSILHLLGRELQVRWKQMPPVQERNGAQWVIEFWEQMDSQ